MARKPHPRACEHRRLSQIKYSILNGISRKLRESLTSLTAELWRRQADIHLPTTAAKRDCVVIQSSSEFRIDR